MRIKVTLFLILTLFSGCIEKRTDQAEDALIMNLTSTDYEIISLALDNFFERPVDSLGKIDNRINKRDYYKLLIAGDSTIVDSGHAHSYAGKMYDLTDSTGKSLINLKYKIDCSRITSYNVHSMTEQETEETYGKGYTKFYEVFPNAYGKISFAKPLYYQGKERAIIYIEFYKQALWAEGAYIWFKFENGKWIFIRKEQSWVS